jgi:putative ABC transport system permease protein
MHFFNSTIYELKQAYLNLKQKPLFVFSVVSTMGITLGALLCVLTLAYVMLIKPLPYPEQNRLYVVEHQSLDKNGKVQLKGFDYPTLVGLYKKQTQFTQSAMIFQSEEVILSHPKQVLLKTTFVTPQWFSLFAVPMQLGRAFNSDEDLNKNIPVAVLGYKTWQQDYDSDADIINKTIDVNDVSFKIIGVVAKEFVDPQLNDTGFDTQLWLPWDFNSISYKKDWWGSYSSNLLFIGRLANKLSLPQIKQQTSNLLCTILQPIIDDGFPDACQGSKIIFQSIKKSIVGDTSNTLYLLLAGIIALLIIAAINIINLFIAHTAEQQQTLAINAALGAKKSQLFRQLFYQASLLMLAATLLSLFIAVVGFTLLSRYLNSIFPLINTLSLQSETIIPQIILSTILTFVFAKLSTNTINYRQLNQNLEHSGKGTGIQISAKLRSLLIISQISIASLLVFCCINLMLNAFYIINKPLGYQYDNLSYLSVSISRTGDNKKFVFEKDFALINQIKSNLLALPEVAAISVAESPIGGSFKQVAIEINTGKRYMTDTSFGDQNYFDIIGQSLIAGDNFPKQNKQDRNMVLIINDVFAKKLAEDGKTIGRKLDLSSDGSNVFTVIGIVKGILEPGQNKIPPRMYLQSSPLAAKFLIRYKKNHSLNRENIINSLRNISSLLTIAQYKSLNDNYKWIVMPERITLVSSITMTLVSLFLAAIGLYGILSYSTQMRRFEIGTRMAIGAKRGDLIKLIIEDNAKAILLGIGISVLLIAALVLGFSEQLASYLTWQLIPLFLITLGLVSLISFAACYLPLRQYINNPAMYSLRGSE